MKSENLILLGAGIAYLISKKPINVSISLFGVKQPQLNSHILNPLTQTDYIRLFNQYIASKSINIPEVKINPITAVIDNITRLFR